MAVNRKMIKVFKGIDYIQYYDDVPTRVQT